MARVKHWTLPRERVHTGNRAGDRRVLAADPPERAHPAPLPRSRPAGARPWWTTRPATATTAPTRSRPRRSSTGCASSTSRCPTSSASCAPPTRRACRAGGRAPAAAGVRAGPHPRRGGVAAPAAAPEPAPIQVELRAVPAITVAAVEDDVDPTTSCLVRRRHGRAGRRGPATRRRPGGLYDNALFDDGRGHVLSTGRRPTPRGRPGAPGDPAGRRTGRHHPRRRARRHRRHLRRARRLGGRERARGGRPRARDLPVGPAGHAHPAAWRTEIGWPVFRVAKNP